ncbi:MAG: hypothetical protein KDA41_08610, partial [Planctomycetales bacterium]|nr:hypothetical protein [Planctomycetales bacterium]
MDRVRSQISGLEERATAPEAVAGLPIVRDAIIRVTNSRNDLTAALLAIHDDRPVLRAEYEALAHDGQVAAALRELGPAHRLGPLEDYDAEPFLRSLAPYESQVFTDDLPLYRIDDDLRVAGFVGRTPVTFTWNSSSEPTLIAASVIEAAGLIVPNDAPRVKRRMPDGRELVVRQFTIPYVRFGRHVLQNVEARALPPEGENLGTRIGPAAFAGLSPKTEPERFRLVIR